MKWLIILLMTCLIGPLRSEVSGIEMKKRVCSILPNLRGWCSQEKALHFIDLVLETEPDVCVEIGVFGGASLFPVASALKYLEHGVVIAIDPWDTFECIKYLDPIENQADLEWWGELDMDYVYDLYVKMVKTYGLEDFCSTLRMTSQEASDEVGSIDILHIDGNHSEISFTEDVKLYLPKVRRGGYIWLNDAIWENAQEAIEILLEDCDVVKVIDSGNCLLFQKK